MAADEKRSWRNQINRLQRIVDPDTGLPYNVPNLDPEDPGYVQAYAYVMWLRETSPETFRQILNWG